MSRPLLATVLFLLSSRLWALDSGPSPTLHLLLAPQSLHSDEATLVWEKPPGDLPAGTTYEVSRDGAVIAATTKLYLKVDALAPDHDYVFAVRAKFASPTATMRSNALSLHTPPREPVVLVTDHGAVGDGKTLDTRALQTAIDACPPGGIVRIPTGVFLSGALWLKSDMTLEIAKGGVLQGSANPDDYLPLVRNRFEGWELDTFASLLNAGRLDHTGPANVRNLSIRGEGVISGGGRKLADAMMARHHDKTAALRCRGRLVLLMNGNHVEIAGLTLKNSPSWTLHYIYSSDITCRDLDIQSDIHNGDGMDPDSSSNVFVFGCTFSTGDDCIAIKSGKNPEGNAINRPSENIRVFDCRFDRGHGISIGTEMSGGVRNVLIEDCIAGPLLNGLQIKATPQRGGYVEDVTVRDCDLQKITVLSSVNYNNDGAAAPEEPWFRRFRFENLDLTSGKPGGKKPMIDLNGFAAKGHELSGVTLADIRLPAGATIKVDQARDVVFQNITTADGAPPAYHITNSENIAH